MLSELRRRLPTARFVYLGDTANLPYGTKSATHVKRLSRDCAETLKAEGIDAVVVACNTASALALDEIRQTMGSIPVFGVVEPGVEAVQAALHTHLTPAGGAPVPVLLLATQATVKSGVYARLLEQAIGYPPLLQACPLLVPIIEEGWVDHPVLHQTIAAYVDQHRQGVATGIALLGCTHYPWVQAAFERALPGWTIINSAQAVAAAVVRSDWYAQWSVPGDPTPSGGAAPAPVEWIFTDPEAVPDFAARWV